MTQPSELEFSAKITCPFTITLLKILYKMFHVVPPFKCNYYTKLEFEKHQILSSMFLMNTMKPDNAASRFIPETFENKFVFE